MSKHQLWFVGLLLVVGLVGTVLSNFLGRNSATDNRNLQTSTGIKKQVLETLELTSDQKTKMAAIRGRYQTQIEQKQREVSVAQQELRELFIGTASEEELRRQRSQVLALQQELTQLRFESLLELRATLNPEQRRRFANSFNR